MLAFNKQWVALALLTLFSYEQALSKSKKFNPSKTISVNKAKIVSAIAGISLSGYLYSQHRYHKTCAQTDLGCDLSNQDLDSARTLQTKQTATHTTNIFVHGTNGGPGDFLLGLPSIINDSVNESNNLFKNTANCEEFWGLQQIKFNKAYVRVPFPGSTNTRIFSILQKRYHPNTKHIYYGFTWSGVLSHSWRCYGALDLYNCILKLPEKHKQDIRLYGYSHGGNLLMLLSKVDYYLKWHRKRTEKNEPTVGCCTMHDQSFVRIAEKYILKHPELVDPNNEFIRLNKIWIIDAPLQAETRNLARRRVCSTYIVLYSPKPIWDFISTKGRRSYSTLTNNAQAFDQPNIYQMNTNCSFEPGKTFKPNHIQFAFADGECHTPVFAHIPAIERALADNKHPEQSASIIIQNHSLIANGQSQITIFGKTVEPLYKETFDFTLKNP